MIGMIIVRFHYLQEVITMINKKVKILVVGGGAGGLELIARLSKKFKQPKI